LTSSTPPASADAAGGGPLGPIGDRAVIDLSSGIAGAYCTKLLRGGGARVLKAESPDGDALRSWSASGATVDPVAGGPLFSFLACGKESLVVGPTDERALTLLDEHLAGADVVVWSPGSALAALPSLQPSELLARHPHLVVTAITPFGLRGPWAGRPATEFTLQAWSGAMIGLGRGSPDRAPVHVGGQIGDWVVGAHAAVAALAALRRSSESGGELVDVSQLEAMVLALTCYPVTFLDMSGRPWRSSRTITVPGVVEAKDGLVGLACGHLQQWQDFCVMIDRPDWLDDEGLSNHQIRADRADEIAPVIAAWAGARTTDEIRELATAFRIPNAPIGSGATIPGFDHLVGRRSFVVNPRDGFLQPDEPFRLSGAEPAELRPPPSLGEHRHPPRPARPHPTASTVPPRPLAGIRVLDLTAFWAGPHCGHVLAMLGAEVLHVESVGRPDGFRLLAGIPQSVDQWWERAPQFSGGNTNKLGITLDFQHAEGRAILDRLIATADVVIENFSPRVLDNIGLDAAAAHVLRPDLVMVRMPGFGLDGPWRDIPAFAYVIEDASGLTWMTGYPDGPPQEPYSVGDPNAGVHAAVAVLLALAQRDRTGDGVFVEASMIGAALNVAAEQVIEHSAHGALLERAGNRGPRSAPQNLYQTADLDDLGRDDTWVAIAVDTDEQWASLASIVGLDPSTASRLATVGRRRTAHDEIDQQLAAWCRDRAIDDIVRRLWAAGVPVAPVMQPHHIGSLEQLVHRGFFEEVVHPVAGAARHSGLPVRFSHGPDTYHRTAAPTLGQHNQQVLRELGFSDDEIDGLEQRGVIGTAPLGSGPAARPTAAGVRTP